MSLQPHELRVVEEAHELKVRMDKLENFVHMNPAFDDLPEWDKALLAIQLEAMKTYNRVLVLRVSKFGG
jgi:hypothetical protein